MVYTYDDFIKILETENGDSVICVYTPDHMDVVKTLKANASNIGFDFYEFNVYDGDHEMLKTFPPSMLPIVYIKLNGYIIFYAVAVNEESLSKITKLLTLH